MTIFFKTIALALLTSGASLLLNAAAAPAPLDVHNQIWTQENIRTGLKSLYFDRYENEKKKLAAAPAEYKKQLLNNGPHTIREKLGNLQSIDGKASFLGTLQAQIEYIRAQNSALGKELQEVFDTTLARIAPHRQPEIGVAPPGGVMVPYSVRADASGVEKHRRTPDSSDVLLKENRELRERLKILQERLDACTNENAKLKKELADTLAGIAGL